MREGKADNQRHRTVKLALAVVLSAAFIVVVVVQVKTYSGDTNVSTENRLAEEKVQSDAGERPVRAPDRGTNPASGEPRVSWPEVDVAQCTVYDPFKAPEGFVVRQEKAAKQEGTSEARQQEIEAAQRLAAERQAIAELMETGVNAVFVGPEHRTAMVGTQQLEVGQEIHGHRVIAIESHGVVLETIESDAGKPVP